MEIAPDNTTIVQAAWSPDGRLLVYSDTDGLWLWDALLENSQPQLLLATENGQIPLARYFSPSGRFLAITISEENHYLDLVSGQLLPDGIFSPDEQYLIAFDTINGSIQGFRCSVPFQNCIGIEGDDFIIRHIAWVDNRNVIISICHEPTSECRVTHNNIYGYFGTAYGDNVSEFAYQQETNLLAILQDEYVININRDGWENLNLESSLDSPIDKIEWMPSLFYYGE